ncbi:unnamed protein product, partial [Gongylonema pulchrum]|uniref:RxLR effector candidate protein n=1 Tax=Gongylonema pulchrum TaxID=637853 RepID=A0A183EPN6_9BILA
MAASSSYRCPTSSATLLFYVSTFLLSDILAQSGPSDALQQIAAASNAASPSAADHSRFSRETKQSAPSFQSFGKNITLTKEDKIALAKVSEIADSVLNRLGLSSDFTGKRYKPSGQPYSSFQTGDLNSVVPEANQNRIDLQ